MTDNTDLKRLAQRVIDIEALDGGEPIGEAWGEFEAAATPAAVLALIAENEEYKAVAEQPASLNAVPATEYAVLKRQFFALRNYALCKDKLSGYYSRELEKLRGVDRSQSAGEIDAERDINEQLTNDLLTVETERDHLKAEVAGFKTGYEAYEQVNAGLKAEVEGLRQIISDSATSCGAAVSVECTLDFMKHLPVEIFSVISKLRNALAECADSLHGEMLQKFGGQLPDDMHPVTRREYDRDMAEVVGCRAALGQGEQS